jgi:hypothetical protein
LSVAPEKHRQVLTSLQESLLFFESKIVSIHLMKSRLLLLLLAFASLQSLFAGGSPPGAPTPAAAGNLTGTLYREGGDQLPTYPVVVRNEVPSQRDARMKWFHDAHFGIFIHWGV